MSQPNGSGQLPRPISAEHELLNRILELDSPRSSDPRSPPGPSSSDMADSQDDFDRRLIRRFSRKVIPELPRSQTFERQLDERPKNLAPVEVSALERRNRSADRRSNRPGTSSQYSDYSPTGLRTPSLYDASDVEYGHSQSQISLALSLEGKARLGSNEESSVRPGSLSVGSVSETDSVMDELRDDKPQFAIPPGHFDPYLIDIKSLSAEEYDDLIRTELDYVWILNLSMHFRDNSKREKFFVTYRQTEHSSRRVTISIDARGAEPGSIEAELFEMKAQRDKNARIYVALRQSLPEIEFFDTVTNLKLQTTDGHLHIHAVEDGNEIISYPPVLAIKHLQCLRVRERDIEFISHISCFVYKVKVNDVVLIKKEIPGPETIDEFLYEVNALHSLRFAPNVAQFYGVVVDDEDRLVTGLLLGYAEQGTLQDMIFHNCKESNNGIPWSIRERWARQLVKGLADIHETGFIQGDFTLTNVVIDAAGNAQIIDINRRGCPIKWEPPEVSSLVEAGQRLTLFISDKSDLYQLGMVLWALAMEEDEPEDQGRPLILGPEVNVPDWYRCITEICLSYDPRSRKHASQLLQLIPTPEGAADMSSEERQAMQSTLFNAQYDLLRARPTAWADQSLEDDSNARPLTYDPFYTRRGRSPPHSPTQSNTSRPAAGAMGWSAYRSTPSYNSADTRLTVPSYPPENRLLQLPGDSLESDHAATPNNETAPARRSAPSSISKASHSQHSQDAEWRPHVPRQPRAKLERQQTITPDSYQNREWDRPMPPSVPSWISRVSSPDFEHEGGADLARTTTNESVSVRSDHGRGKA